MKREWLTERNSIQEIAKWVTNLKYGYLWKRPSFRDDTDYFIIKLEYSDKRDLINILEKLNITWSKLQTDQPSADKERDKSSKRLPNFQIDHLKYQSFGHIEVMGIPSYVSLNQGIVSFRFSDSMRPYSVDEPDFKRIFAFEKLLISLGLTDKVNRDMESNPGTLTLSKYPFLKDYKT